MPYFHSNSDRQSTARLFTALFATSGLYVLQLHSSSVPLFFSDVTPSFNQFFPQPIERLVHVIGGFCTSLYDIDRKLFAKSKGILGLHFLVLHKICFVSDNELRSVFARIFVHLPSYVKENEWGKVK
uniref:Uncharacterized protein n=1 Tax=Lotharella globosa TaxID=91324 RepID=A0A7S3ZDT4_9EUKA